MIFPSTITPKGAVFSSCGNYRHLLWRTWGPGVSMLHICGLNPSTANAEFDDPTIRREIDFAKRFGFDGLMKTNAFDLRATDPRVMLAAVNPNSDENDDWINECNARSLCCAAAWGVHGDHRGRATYLKNCYDWKCFGVTKDGHPKHPLYLPKTTTLIDLP